MATTIYGTLQGFKDYHTERGNNYSGKTDGELSSALIRASEYIDGRYSFPGDKVGGRDQERSWPRSSVVDIDIDEIPKEVINATYEITLREVTTPGVMQPDIRRSDRKKSVAVVGAVSVEYVDAPSLESFRLAVTIADAIIAPILSGGTGTSNLSGAGWRI